LALTNQFGTNFTSGNLPAVLANLQNDLNQALPLLAAFNANVLGGNLGLQTLTAPVAGTAGGAANFAQNFGTSSAANMAANLAANVATPTAPALATPPTGTTSFGGSGTNSMTQTVSPDAARLLVVLESDLERVLPELAAFTGGAVSLPTGLAVNPLATPMNPGGTFVTNQFVFPHPTPNATRTVTPQQLTPTGR